MAFKTFFSVLLLFFVLFAVAKGSCLEYGHSCWGAHGKRSDNSQIFPVDMKPAAEIDFADINAIKESPYDSTEDHLMNANDKTIQNRETPNADNEEIDNVNLNKALKLQNLFFKHFNRTVRQRVQDAAANDAKAIRKNKNVMDSLASERWRRLPIWKIRRYQDNWKNNLDNNELQSPQLNDDSDNFN